MERIFVQINFDYMYLSEGAKTVREKGHIPHFYASKKKNMCDR